MKRLLLPLLLFALIPAAFAQVPGTLSYQGLLVDNLGAPVTDGNHSVTFKFYKDPLGLTRLDEDFFRGPFLVTTFKGLFTFVIGSGVPGGNTALPVTAGSQQYYVGITVDSNPENTPRIALTSVPYAFTAQVANSMDATNLTGQVTIAHGGTGASTAAGARTALGAGTVTNVTGTGPISVATGTSTPAISIQQANGTTDGYLSSTDWTAFNTKLSTASVLGGDLSGTSATAKVTGLQGKSVAATAPTANQVLQYIGTTWTPSSIPAGTVTGISASSPLLVVSPTTTPALSIQVAKSGQDGYLSSVDWNSFNSKIGTASNGLFMTAGNVSLGGSLTAHTTIANAGFNLAVTGAGNVGVGTATPATKLHVVGDTEIDGILYAGGASAAGLNLWTRAIFYQPTAARGSSIHLLSADAGNTTSDGAQISLATGASPSLEIANRENGNIVFNTTSGYTTRMTITSTGLVGIGTVPGYPLHVVTPSTGVTAYFDNNTTAGGTGLYSVVNNTALSTGTRYGVQGVVSGGQGLQIGVYGISSATGTTNYGVYGAGSGASGTNYGVFGTSSGTGNYGLYCSGNGAYTGLWSLSSDRKLKRDIHPIENALEDIMKLKPSIYYFRTDEYRFMALAEGKQLGLIAQEVEEVFPEVVTNNVHPGPIDKDGKLLGKEVKFKGIDYPRLIPPVIKAIQEQQAQFIQQQKLVVDQQRQIQELTSAMTELKSRLRQYEELSSQVEELRKIILEKANIKSSMTGSTGK